MAYGLLARLDRRPPPPPEDEVGGRSCASPAMDRYIVLLLALDCKPTEVGAWGCVGSCGATRRADSGSDCLGGDCCRL